MYTVVHTPRARVSASPSGSRRENNIVENIVKIPFAPYGRSPSAPSGASCPRDSSAMRPAKDASLCAQVIRPHAVITAPAPVAVLLLVLRIRLHSPWTAPAGCCSLSTHGRCNRSRRLPPRCCRRSPLLAVPRWPRPSGVYLRPISDPSPCSRSCSQSE